MKHKRSWGGRDRDKHFGPFTWTSNATEQYPASTVGIEYIVETRGTNVLRVMLRRGTLHCEMPRWLKAAPPHPGHGDYDPCERRYGFDFRKAEQCDETRFSTLSVTLRYGAQATMSWSDKDKAKTWHFPWAGVQFKEIAHLDEDRVPRVVIPEDFILQNRESRFAVGRALENLAPVFKFAFCDYDGEQNICTARIDRRTWDYGYGKGWFWRLLNGFKTLQITSLDLNFDKEVGKQKGSWKGGTIGTGIDLRDKETPQEAFVRWCGENDCTFVGRVGAPKPKKTPDAAEGVACASGAPS